mgnify:FL=1
MAEVDILSMAKETLRKISDLIEAGNSWEALILINRCVRKLDKFIQGASGPEKLEALVLMRKLGKIQIELEGFAEKNDVD